MEATTGLQVIGAGWGRTGTDSTKVALEKLGYKCQHAKVLSSCSKDTQVFWSRALQRKYGPPAMDLRLWEKEADNMPWNTVGFAGGFTACVDFPFAPFYKEMLEANPNAKVILTVRDNGEKWYKSTYDTIYGFYRNGGLVMELLKLTSPFAKSLKSLWEGMLQGSMEDPSRAVKLYDEHIEEVKRYVPAHQLLVFNVKQGWEPLCAFLDKPIPGEAFPHVNSSEEMKNIARFFYWADLAIRSAIIALVAVVVYWLC